MQYKISYKVQKKTKEARNAVAKREPVKEKVARIHVLKENDLDSKLKANIASLKKAYPQVMPEQMKIHDLITNVFPAKLKQQIPFQTFTRRHVSVFWWKIYTWRICDR